MRKNRVVILWVGVALIILGYSVQAGKSDSKKVKEITCSGKVVDERGQPIAGVKVSFHEMVYDQATSTYDPKAHGQVQTGTDGAFSFSETVKEDQYRYGYVVAEKEGLALGFDSWNTRDADTKREITLGPPKELAGRVVDEKNAPVPGARVIVSMLVLGEGPQRKEVSRVTSNLLATETDANGQFVFGRIPAGATAEFIAEKAGRATVSTYKRTGYAYQKLNFTEGQTDIKLAMPEEAKIKGVVVERNSGKPVGSLRVKYTSENELAYFRSKPLVSGEDGTFRIDGLAPARYLLQLVQPMEELAEWVAEPAEVSVEAGQVSENIRIELSKGGLLEVLVTQAGTNKPLEGVSVSIYDGRRQQSYRGATGDDGVGRIRLLPGAYQWGHAYKTGFSSAEHRDPVTIEGGSTKRLEWQLAPAPEITGVVRDPAGKPIEGAALAVCPMGGSRDVTSDAEGKFEVSWDQGMAVDERQAPHLVCRHMERNLAAVAVIPEGKRSLDITLKPGVIAVGKVVDPNDRAIPNAQIRVMLRQTMWAATMSRESIRTDAEGTFEIKALPVENRYELSVYAVGYGSQRTEIHADDAVDRRIEIEKLVLPAANLTVSGRVVDTQGNPLANARLESYNYEGGQPERLVAQTDSEGTFFFEGVCEGKLNIRVTGDSKGKRLSARVITNGGATGITIVAREGRPVIQNLETKTYDQIIQNSEKVIAGVAIDESGSPVAGVPVGVCCHKMKREDGKFMWRFSSYEDLSATTDEQGRFAIELKEDGEYNLRVSPDHLAAMIVYDIPVGKKDLKVILPEGGTVTGRLVRMEGGRKVPIPNVEVKIEQPDRASYTHLGFDRDRTSVTDAEGRFRFEHLRTKIRPHGSMSRQKWDYIARVWEISYGDTSKTIAFYDDKRIDDLELLVRPKLTEVQPLVGQVVPDFDNVTIDLDTDQTEKKMMLICFFDMNQRPSRHCVTQLAERAEYFRDKGVIPIAVQTAEIDQNALDEWVKKSNILFPVGRIRNDEKETRFNWGVKSLPWIILTDHEHVVRAEGFSLGELNEKLGQTGDTR